jgi:hypothetical protein
MTHGNATSKRRVGVPTVGSTGTRRRCGPAVRVVSEPLDSLRESDMPIIKTETKLQLGMV